MLQPLHISRVHDVSSDVDFVPAGHRKVHGRGSWQPGTGKLTFVPLFAFKSLEIYVTNQRYI